jgi:hypothetical protein
MMNIIKGDISSIQAMFKTMGGWTSQFEVDGNFVGGTLDLSNYPIFMHYLKLTGGIKNNRILELGPLEGCHTKVMIEAGAKEVVAVEGNPDCFLRCLIVKEAFQLTRAKFLFGDFNIYIRDYQGKKFDFVSASGVLYHQTNPAELIYNMSKITDTVIVWTHVANTTHPSTIEDRIESKGISYRGKINDYKGVRDTSDIYCGGLNDKAFWMYPEEMIECFTDAGFTNIKELSIASTVNGDCMTFIASKY